MNSCRDVETQFLDLPGGRLAHDITGAEGAALVLCVAGMGDVRAAFRFLAPKLVEAGHRRVHGLGCSFERLVSALHVSLSSWKEVAG